MSHQTILDIDQVFLKSIDQSFDGFVLSDIKGRIFYANKAVEEISGVPTTEIVGKTTKDMEEDGIIISQSMKILKRDPLTISQKLRTGVEVFITSKPVYNEDGQFICYVANYHRFSRIDDLYREHHNQVDINYTELRQLRLQMLKTDEWIGASFETKKLKEKVAKVAKTEANILIIGESGVGKEVVSKTIHKVSDRREFPFIQINCGAIPETLIEAELFGHEKGAFTGALSAKPGLLEAADKGTVLLDEIGEIPLHLQVKLLRVIQTREVTRVGGTKPRKLDIRFLAATNRDLKQMVQVGKFREDLYYRLNVIPIKIPSLRDRKEDIPVLCRHFLEKYNKKYAVEKRLTDNAYRLLSEYAWPGNVRQLENTMEQLVILTEGFEIDGRDLPRELLKNQVEDYFPDEIIPLPDLREQTEKRMIRLALERYKTIREAAKHLGVDHSTLVKKIKRYGM